MVQDEDLFLQSIDAVNAQLERPFLFALQRFFRIKLDMSQLSPDCRFAQPSERKGNKPAREDESCCPEDKHQSGDDRPAAIPENILCCELDELEHTWFSYVRYCWPLIIIPS